MTKKKKISVISNSVMVYLCAINMPNYVIEFQLKSAKEIPFWRTKAD